MRPTWSCKTASFCQLTLWTCTFIKFPTGIWDWIICHAQALIIYVLYLYRLLIICVFVSSIFMDSYTFGFCSFISTDTKCLCGCTDCPLLLHTSLLLRLCRVVVVNSSEDINKTTFVCLHSYFLSDLKFCFGFGCCCVTQFDLWYWHISCH